MPKHETDAKKAAKAAVKKGKEGKAHLVVLMDESGSMSGKEEAVVTGCNEFLHAFKDNKSARAWVAFFDSHPGEDRTRFKLRNEKITKSASLKTGDYRPRGMTPLNDAIADTITAVAKTAGNDDTVFVAIITDGMENASETSTEQVKALIAKYEKKGWGFVYLGANQHAETSAANLGLAKKGQSFNFNATRGGVKSTMRSMSDLAASRVAAGPGAQGLSQYEMLASAAYDQTGGKIEDDPEDE